MSQRQIAGALGITQPAVSQQLRFGSVARHEARQDFDIDLLVEAPDGTSSFDFVRFKKLVEQALGREVDLVSDGGLQANIDDDIRGEAILL